MNVRVEPVKCQGYAACNELAPEVFKLDEWNFAYVEDGTEITDDLRPRVEQAVAACPAKAIVAGP